MSLFILTTYRPSQLLISLELQTIISRFLLVPAMWLKHHEHIKLHGWKTKLIIHPHLKTAPLYSR